VTTPASFLPALLRGLRAAGVTVSPGEAIDAARALALVALDDRALVQAALGATLAKTRDAQIALGPALAAALPLPSGGAAAEGRPGKGKRPGAPESAGGGGAPPGSTPTGGAGGGGGGGRPANRPPDALPPARSPAERRAREHREKALAGLEGRGERRRGETHDVARRSGGQTSGPASDERRRRRRRARLAPLTTSSPRGRGAAAKAAERDAAGDAGRRAARAARDGGADQDLLRRDLRAPLDEEQEARWERLLERALSDLGRRARGRRLRSRRGALDAHRLFRAAVATGGVPFALPRRVRRPRPLRLVLVVDVSWSARRAARAFLVLARALARRFRETRVLLFVDRPVEVTGALARGEGLARAHLRHPHLRPGARSDYAKALYALVSGFGDALRRDALVVVLGDARNNFLPSEAWCVEEIASRAAGLVWLAPEPRDRWGAGDSALLDYAPHCDVIREGDSLEEMALAVRALSALR